MVHYHSHHQAAAAAVAAAAGQNQRLEHIRTRRSARIHPPVSVVEVVDLTKMAKAKEASASTLTIDITAAKHATDETSIATRHHHSS
jgi:hypothetical protein